MINEQKLEADIAEAIGKTSAGLCLIQAIVATLVTRKTMSREDAATLAADAAAALQATPDLPDDARMMAEAALRGFSSTWVKLVPRN